MNALSIVALWLMVSSAAIGQLQTFEITSASSEVRITLNTNHEVVHGTFRVQSGQIQFDESAQRMSGAVLVNAGSSQTGNETRDKRMHKEVLKVEQYSTITYEPKSYTGTLASSGDSTIQVTGIFTLLGTPHELTLPMVIQREGATATARSQFRVPYVQWGLKDPSLFIWKADKEVDIAVVLNGHVSR